MARLTTTPKLLSRAPLPGVFCTTMASRVSVPSGNGIDARCRLIRGDRYNPLTRCCDSCVTGRIEGVTRENVERFKKSAPADRNTDALWSHPIHVVSVRHARNT